MNDTINSIEAFQKARARAARLRELECEQAARAAEAALPRQEARAIAHERARWKKKDYKPGRLAPGSTTQYTKTYKREESEGVRRRRRQRRVEREQVDKVWREKERRESQRRAEARCRARKSEERRRLLSVEEADMLRSDDRSLMTLKECAEEMNVALVQVRRLLRLYGAERQEDGCYLRGQVLRAALVYRQEHPCYKEVPQDFYTYDEAAEFVGVARKTVENHAREEQWERIYAFIESKQRTLALLAKKDVCRYKAAYDEWLDAGESDHTHCLKLRQRRRNSPRKPKRR